MNDKENEQKLVLKLKEIYNKMHTEKYSKIIILLYCLFNAIIFLTICSKNSFIYPFNNWDDPNSFFTMGKGMANGSIIYKDLFEQKGPLLYLLHAIAYIISNDTFIGIYIFEIIAFTVFLYFNSKIISLYCRKTHILWGIPLISYIILSSYVFIAGDSAEEFCLPLLAISLYYFLNYFKNTYPNKMPTKEVIINGIIAGCVLWIKYNLLGFWLGFAAFLCIGLLINKKVKEAFLTGTYFFLGMLIVSIPWLIYFAITNSLSDMLNVYFFINMSSYTTQTPIITRTITALKDSTMYIKNLPIFSGITLLGYIYIMFNKKIIPNIYGKIALTLTILISTIAVYFGANHIYYFLILMAFIILGVIGIAKIIEKIFSKKVLNLFVFATPIYMLVFILLCCTTSQNFEFRKVNKDDLVQFQFAKIIEQKTNATLLNYGFLDGGFYTVTNIVPNIKYFHKPNISYEKYPEIMDEQNRYIKERLIDFVVIMTQNEENSHDIPYLYENYEKVTTQYVEEVSHYYMLFEIKEK